MEIPISKNIIEPKIISNIQYIDSIEEVEKLELHPNEVKLLFDNNRPCFYVKSRARKFQKKCKLYGITSIKS